MRRTTRLIASGCVAVLALGACGSSYKGLSKAEFIKQAGAICTKSSADVQKIGNAVGKNPTVQQVKDAYLNKLVPAFNDEVDQLRALKPPKDDRETVSKMLDDLSAGFAKAEALVKTLKTTKDLSSLQEPAELKAANAAAKAYGLDTCAGSNG